MANLHAATLDKLNDSDIAMPYLAEAIDVTSVLAAQAQASMVAFQITRTMARAMLEFLDSDDARDHTGRANHVGAGREGRGGRDHRL